jgi:hypothetical protein
MHSPWTCACCGKEFDDLPLDVAIGRGPAPYEDLTEAERARASLTSDFCVIENADQIDRFIRAVVEVPVHNLSEPFRWGVWVSLSESSFVRAKQLFPLAEMAPDEPARFGWLSSRIFGYTPSTLNLKTMLTFRGGNQRPSVAIEPSDHPFSVEQREGISVRRVQEIVAPLLHRSGANDRVRRE